MVLSQTSLVLIVIAGLAAAAAALALIALILDVRAAYRSHDLAEHESAQALIGQMLGGVIVAAGGVTLIWIYLGRVLPAVVCACLFWLASVAAARFVSLEHAWRRGHPQIDT